MKTMESRNLVGHHLSRSTVTPHRYRIKMSLIELLTPQARPPYEFSNIFLSSLFCQYFHPYFFLSLTNTQIPNDL